MKYLRIYWLKCYEIVREPFLFIKIIVIVNSLKNLTIPYVRYFKYRYKINISSYIKIKYFSGQIKHKIIISISWKFPKWQASLFNSSFSTKLLCQIAQPTLFKKLKRISSFCSSYPRYPNWIGKLKRMEISYSFARSVEKSAFWLQSLRPMNMEILHLAINNPAIKLRMILILCAMLIIASFKESRQSTLKHTASCSWKKMWSKISWLRSVWWKSSLPKFCISFLITESKEKPNNPRGQDTFSKDSLKLINSRRALRRNSTTSLTSILRQNKTSEKWKWKNLFS